MPSRKRNKGKERKAKKAGEWWRSWAFGGQENWASNIIGCHGCVAIPPSDHAFMNTFDELCRARGNGAYKAMRGAADAHPEVWNDADHRQLAMVILLSREQTGFWFIEGLEITTSRNQPLPKQYCSLNHMMATLILFMHIVVLTQREKFPSMVMSEIY